ncbi:MAG TPA: cobaltochelatase subunit CobN, partial [Acetobacteraceae bacterium]|nr:cobaltochelatase subunit CobN [Acetobacteraceae bacterium]
PDVVLNATSFSARSDESGAGSPLDAADAPVLQLVLSGASRAAWAESFRGLSQADLAMHVVLPELDGRLLTTAISFKAETGTEEALEYARVAHRPDADGIALAAARAEGWARLRRTPAAERRLAIVLPDYPGAGGQAGRAVGLDGFASLAALLRQLGESGYDIGNVPPDAEALANALCRGPGDGSSPGGVRGSAPGLCLPHYRPLLETLPQTTRAALEAAWGPPEDDPLVADGVFPFPCLRTGRMLLAIQPDRGSRLDRKSGYHDPDLPPRHAYVAFHLWLRQEVGVHALVQLGAHGSLEWLPGKAAALSPACFPAALIGGLPVIYPFIVNNPGEAAAAKRRLGAVTIGHLTPPLRSAGTHGEAAALERLIDEYAAADGLDRRRTALLRREILERADAAGLIEESGASGLPEDDALARLDAWLCDIKDMQIRDGLHVFGQAPDAPRRAALLDALARSCPGLDPAMLATRLDACAAAERDALRAALEGRFVPAGPAGAPTRGRADVLPTGRNLHAVDPRAIPTRSALALAERAAAELLRRHVQETGDWPRSLVLDLWGSTTMRTGGEDLALALVLIGARPVWDEGSARVSGFEILPLATLDRPRVDVTLRVSGLFRDAFPAQIALFDAAVRAVAARDEAVEWNKLAAACRGLDGAALRRASTRIYGAAPGAYGAGVADEITRGAWARREELGASYLAASSAAYGKDLDGIADAEGFAARVATAGGFVHLQDQAGTDLLDGLDQATHAGGFAAAAQALGGARDGAAALYQLDISATETPRARTLTEAVARAVRGRAANPAWIAGMRRHGHQGAAEIAGALEALHAFAATLPGRLDRQYDQIFAATLADPAVERFLREANPAAHAAMRARFAEARRRGLWHSRRNDVAALLDDAIADDIPPKGHTMTEATS